MSEDNPVTVNPVQPEKSIVILYENNVHCGIDGYAKMRGLRDAIVRADTSYVALVNAGDVVVLSHLGETEPHTGINSHKLVESTRGIDVVLDGHTHSVIPCDLVANLDNVLVPTTQTGTKFNNVGKLWISPEGKFVTTLVAKEDIPYTNDAITATTDSIKKLMKNVTIEKMATTDFDLPAMEGSTWLVRHQETTIGNLISDAFRTIFDCQIGLINGGAVRSNINKGVISFGGVIAVQPNDNNMCILQVTGEELMTMLTKSTASSPGDDGSFPQVSGMKFTIHTGSHTVTDVMILDKGKDTFSPLDLNATYTLCTTDYCYNRGGMYKTLANCKLVSIEPRLSRDALRDYLKDTLKGVVPERYKNVEGRITIVND